MWHPGEMTDHVTSRGNDWSCDIQGVDWSCDIQGKWLIMWHLGEMTDHVTSREMTDHVRSRGMTDHVTSRGMTYLQHVWPWHPQHVWPLPNTIFELLEWQENLKFYHSELELTQISVQQSWNCRWQKQTFKFSGSLWLAWHYSFEYINVFPTIVIMGYYIRASLNCRNQT